MANEQNLIPQAHKLTVEEQSAGGKASGKARREKKLLRECLEELLATGVNMQDGRRVDGATAISMKLFQNALNGDVKSFQVIRDTVGQKPVERVETVEISQETYERIAKALED